MNTTEGILEYEILDIDFGISYELPEDDNAFVREDEPTQTKEQETFPLEDTKGNSKKRKKRSK